MSFPLVWLSHLGVATDRHFETVLFFLLNELWIIPLINIHHVFVRDRYCEWTTRPDSQVLDVQTSPHVLLQHLLVDKVNCLHCFKVILQRLKVSSRQIMRSESDRLALLVWMLKRSLHQIVWSLLRLLENFISLIAIRDHLLEPKIQNIMQFVKLLVWDAEEFLSVFLAEDLLKLSVDVSDAQQIWLFQVVIDFAYTINIRLNPIPELKRVTLLHQWQRLSLSCLWKFEKTLLTLCPKKRIYLLTLLTRFPFSS